MCRIKQLAFLILTATVMFIAGCQKEVESIPVSIEELTAYYIIGELSGGNAVPAIFSIHFRQEGTGITAILDMPGARKSFPVEINDRLMSFDPDNSGRKYSFLLQKDSENGTLGLQGYNYSHANIPERRMSYASLVQRSQAPAFEHRDFVTSDSFLLKFTAGSKFVKVHLDTKIISNGSYKPYYRLGEGRAPGWKSENDEWFGISVPEWKGDAAVKMVVINTRSGIFRQDLISEQF